MVFTWVTGCFKTNVERNVNLPFEESLYNVECSPKKIFIFGIKKYQNMWFSLNDYVACCQSQKLSVGTWALFQSLCFGILGGKLGFDHLHTALGEEQTDQNRVDNGTCDISDPFEIKLYTKAVALSTQIGSGNMICFNSSRGRLMCKWAPS